MLIAMDIDDTVRVVTRGRCGPSACQMGPENYIQWLIQVEEASRVFAIPQHVKV